MPRRLVAARPPLAGRMGTLVSSRCFSANTSNEQAPHTSTGMVDEKIPASAVKTTEVAILALG